LRQAEGRMKAFALVCIYIYGRNYTNSTKLTPSQKQRQNG
jgi:hypothetical protein